ncbi:YdcH family protein [Vibrio algarum]|uniref:YdcH family protein n=1 Tax=Vibrio algarum TaxID=3020714 RepID=A0ABT4YYJ9_9VIBR|nr:YdcH family protein [Vibrio sp. KJ40-1]MDB1126231.1 YdcH family protein [Vibrio sp. KJ40-1]
MLNENHAFILDFPDLKLDIVQLNHDDPTFKADLQKYHELDYDIRQLEISGSPIDDDNMHALKVQRMELKDILYVQLTKHHTQESNNAD